MNYKSVVQGKRGITARVVAKSVAECGTVITTFECEYHRYIHGELLTHRQFSRGAASSRAIPIEKVIENVVNNTAIPVHWGKKQSGMQANEELNQDAIELADVEWHAAMYDAVKHAKRLDELGLHKQVTNRILEPFQMMKTIITTTELDNFFWLRDDVAAQPELQQLARCMKQAYNEAEAEELKSGEWHTPYVDHYRDVDGNIIYSSGGQELSVEDAKKISVSCCAQVSYRKLDVSLEKAKKIYDMLVSDSRVHASPFEAVATPMEYPMDAEACGWEEGITHSDSEHNFWSGNLKHWIQYRQLIPNHVKK
jgi:hypothetical protein